MFPGEELKQYWPDIVVMSKAAGEDALNLLSVGLRYAKQIFSSDKEFKQYWPDLVVMTQAAGISANKLFVVLPGLIPMLTKKVFKQYWPDIIALVKAAGESAGWLFAYGLPVVKDLIKSQDDFKKVGTDLVEIANSAGKCGEILFTYGLPAMKNLIRSREDLRRIGSDLVAISKASSDNGHDFYNYGLPALKTIITDQDSWDKVKVIMKKLINRLTEYNSRRVLKLLKDEDVIRYVVDHKGDGIKHLEFYVDVFVQNPRMGFQIWEGLFTAVKDGLVSLKLGIIEQEKIRSFIAATKGMNPHLYKIWKKKGQKA